MGKIRQKYNKIKEKTASCVSGQVVFCRKKINEIFDIEGIFVKNSLLGLAVVFLSIFSFLSLESLNNIKSTKIEISTLNIPQRNIKLENRIKKQTSGFPIENMARYIAEEDEAVAAFLVAIAKKESNWGKRTPKLNGEECYNYWGFREKRERMGSGGHTCFDNPEDAVQSVARRIDDLIKKDIDTPEKMVVWKCGYSCESHNPESVLKWIQDVNFYYSKF